GHGRTQPGEATCPAVRFELCAQLTQRHRPHRAGRRLQRMRQRGELRRVALRNRLQEAGTDARADLVETLDDFHHGAWIVPRTLTQHPHVEWHAPSLEQLDRDDCCLAACYRAGSGRRVRAVTPAASRRGDPPVLSCAPKPPRGPAMDLSTSLPQLLL